LSYLLVIWVILAVLVVFMSRFLETSIIGARRASLYAQAHLIASAIRARGGPFEARLVAIGGMPLNARVMVLDGYGRVLDDSASDPDMVLRKLEFQEVGAALSGREGSNTYYLPDGSFVMYVAVPADWDGNGGAVFIAQDLKDIVIQYQNVMRMVASGGIIASMVALVFAWYLSRTISEPISDLSRAARMMASGRLDSRVSPKGPLETRELGASFNYMATEIEKTVEGQEQFLMAAAHELRAPLASMRALVESMQICPPEAEELSELINDVLREILDLQGISESILSLLRTRSGGAVSDEEMIDPAEIIGEVIRSRVLGGVKQNLKVILQGSRQDKGIVEPRPMAAVDSSNQATVVHEREGQQQHLSGAKVQMDPLLFRLIVANLFDNAVKFTPPGGTVVVSMDFPENGDEMVLKVSDTGPGIPPEHLDRIFDRFYRIDPARQKSTGGAGLGLAIVKEACEKSGGMIEVETRPGGGTIFTVRWRNKRPGDL
jgi:signal transduction histidine kinase